MTIDIARELFLIILSRNPTNEELNIVDEYAKSDVVQEILERARRDPS